MWEKPAQIASKLFLNALLSPPWQCLLFRCLLTVCFVYLQVCCDSRANSKGNWLSSLFLSLSGVLLVLVIVLVAARSLWICKHGHVHTHTQTRLQSQREALTSVAVRSSPLTDWLKLPSRATVLLLLLPLLAALLVKDSTFHRKHSSSLISWVDACNSCATRLRLDKGSNSDRGSSGACSSLMSFTVNFEIFY